MVTAHFFVGNYHVGSGPLPREVHIRLGQVDRPVNTAYFCAACGEVWGRIYIRREQDYRIKHRFCAAHGSGLFQEESSTMWHHYPKEVLYRELNLIAQHYARNPSLDWRELTLNWKRYYD